MQSLNQESYQFSHSEFGRQKLRTYSECVHSSYAAFTYKIFPSRQSLYVLKYSLLSTSAAIAPVQPTWLPTVEPSETAQCHGAGHPGCGGSGWIELVSGSVGEHISCSSCSVSNLCPTLCDPIDCSVLGFSVLHYLPELAQTHVHWVGDAIQSSSSVIPFSSPLQSFPVSRSFPISQLFTSGSQSIGSSASASVLPMNSQNWFPLGWTGWISLQFKGLSRVFCSTTVWKHHFFWPSLWSSSQICTWLLEKP